MVGINKPDERFFQYCFDRIKSFDKQETIMVGDSLTSDMQGARNTGIDFCLYNPTDVQHNPFEYYEVNEISQIINLV